MDWLPQAIRDGIIVTLVISGPLVIAAAAIGLIIGILQAATQVQEQTIGSALKIIGVFALIIFAGMWMYQYLNQYTSRTISTAFTFIPRQTQKVIPPDAFEDEGTFSGRIRFPSGDSPLKVIPPERLKNEAEESFPPGGIPKLGEPDIPKPPEVTKISPPVIPKLQRPPVKPDITLPDFQEPQNIPPPPPIEVNTEDQTRKNILAPPSENIERETQDSQIEQINQLPVDLNKTQKIVLENDETESLPSWLE